MTRLNRQDALPYLVVACVTVVGAAIVGLVAQAPNEPAGPVVGACHVSPMVENLDRAAAFYHGLLGLDLVPAPPQGAGVLPIGAGHGPPT